MIHVKVPLYKSTKGIKVVCFPFPSSVLMRRTKLWCMLLNFILALFYPALLTLNLGQYYNLKTFLAKSLRRLKDGSVVESTICSSRDSEFNFHQPYGGSWVFKEEKILATKQHCEFLVMGKIKYYPYSLLIQDEKNDFIINCHIYWVIMCCVSVNSGDEREAKSPHLEIGLEQSDGTLWRKHKWMKFSARCQFSLVRTILSSWE